MALGMQGHQILFLSNTDCSLFAWVLSLFQVGLRGGDEKEKEWEFCTTDSTYTTPGPPNTCCCSGGKDPVGPLVIKHHVERCLKRPGWTLHPVQTLQTQKLARLKLDVNVILQVRKASSFHLTINKYYSSWLVPSVAVAAASCVKQNLLPAFKLFTMKRTVFMPNFCPSARLNVHAL